MSEWFAKNVRESLYGSDLERAQQVEAKTLAQARTALVSPGVRAELKRLAKTPDEAALIGTLLEAEDDVAFCVALDQLRAHMLVTGANGVGKTFIVILMLVEALTKKKAAAITVFDMKGELAELLTTRVLPAIAMSLTGSERDVFLDRIVVIDPFAKDLLPPLDILVRDPSIPIAVQAQDIAECFDVATDAGSGIRMETILHWLLRLVIEVGGSFHVVRRALEEPALIDVLACHSKDTDVARYFLLRYPQEPRSSKLALLARLDRFLGLPATRRCLAARKCVSFDKLLENRITIVNLGTADAGLHSIAVFFATMLLTRCVRAIFRRPHHGTEPALLIADEWQLALTPALAQEWENVLALARSRNVFAWLVNQQLVQLDKHGQDLRKIVVGQTAVHVAFRMAAEDSHVLRHLFPATGLMPRPKPPLGREPQGSPFLSPAEEREARASGATTLPPRTAYWFDKRGGSALLLRSATVKLPLEKDLPRDVVARTRTGTLTMRARDLDQKITDENTALDQLLQRARSAVPVKASAPVAPVVPSSSVTPPAVPVPSVLPAMPSTPPTPAPAAPPKRRRRRGKGAPNLG